MKKILLAILGCLLVVLPIHKPNGIFIRKIIKLSVLLLLLLPLKSFPQAQTSWDKVLKDSNNHNIMTEAEFEAYKRARGIKPATSVEGMFEEMRLKNALGVKSQDFGPRYVNDGSAINWKYFDGSSYDDPNSNLTLEENISVHKSKSTSAIVKRIMIGLIIVMLLALFWVIFTLNKTTQNPENHSLDDEFKILSDKLNKRVFSSETEVHTKKDKEVDLQKIINNMSEDVIDVIIRQHHKSNPLKESPLESMYILELVNNTPEIVKKMLSNSHLSIEQIDYVSQEVGKKVYHHFFGEYSEEEHIKV